MGWGTAGRGWDMSAACLASFNSLLQPFTNCAILRIIILILRNAAVASRLGWRHIPIVASLRDEIRNWSVSGHSEDIAKHYPAGLEDIVILPLVANALLVKRILRGLLTLLIRLVDFLFPVLLNLMRLPLFTLRILGDAIVALLKGLARVLPMASARRHAWRELVTQRWAWLRQKISYQAFEHAVHHLFENGMAWVFRKCRALTPSAALMVLLGAVLWLPISFGIATLLHMVLIAKALVLPAWMQLLHPLATVIAKSKLLVLPVYPAAWPQAKRHGLIISAIEFWRCLLSLYPVRKTGYRYHQLDDATTRLVAASPVVRLANRSFDALVGAANAAGSAVGRALLALAMGVLDLLARMPLLGRIVTRYREHYEAATRSPLMPLSDRFSAFFSRWSIKFTAEYYEAREREEAALRRAGTGPARQSM